MKESLYKEKCTFIEINYNDTFEYPEIVEDEVYRKSDEIEVDKIEEINFAADEESTGIFSQISVNTKNSRLRNIIEKYYKLI